MKLVDKKINFFMVGIDIKQDFLSQSVEFSHFFFPLSYQGLNKKKNEVLDQN